MLMGEQTEKRFTWVLENFSFFKHDNCYSRPFKVAGCNWRLLAYTKGGRNDGYLSVYLELAPGSLPPGWSRDVEFSLTLVNKGWGKSNKTLEGQCCFDAEDSSWGFNEFLSLSKLRHRRERFLLNDRLTIIAQVQVLPAIVVPEEPVKIIEPLSSKQGNQVSDTFVSKSLGVSPCQMAPQTENASQENLDDDYETDEGTNDDDASGEGTDDDDSCEEDVDNENASRENLDDDDETGEGSDDDDHASDEGSSSPLKKITRNDEGAESNDSLREASLGKESVDVNGFQVLPSQAESVRCIFERHPDIAIEFRAKNQHLRKACMNFLLSLIETLCQSLEELSNEDLVEADIALTYLKDAGFRVDWLEKKLDQVKEKKEKEKSSLVRLANGGYFTGVEATMFRP